MIIAELLGGSYSRYLPRRREKYQSNYEEHQRTRRLLRTPILYTLVLHDICVYDCARVFLNMSECGFIHLLAEGRRRK